MDLLNREYLDQVLVQAENVGGRTLDKVIDFHTKLGIPTKSRSMRKDDAWYSLYCFADRKHAELFRVMFGGEHSGEIEGLGVRSKRRLRCHGPANAAKVRLCSIY